MARPSGRRTSQFKTPPAQPQPAQPSVENNFTSGLKTEFTGLNFPENACTDTSNCIFNRQGNVTRRGGIDTVNQTIVGASIFDAPITTYVWTNPGGFGNTQILVAQCGAILNFFLVSNVLATSGIQSSFIGTTVNIQNFATTSTTVSTECTFSAGNGYLFVYNVNTDPFYVTWDGINLVANAITVQIRDFQGIAVDGTASVTDRPTTLTNEHKYNISNQGWIGNGTVPQVLNIHSNTNVTVFSIGSYTFTVAAGLGIIPGNAMTLYVGSTFVGSGVISTYTGTSLTVIITSLHFSINASSWTITTAGTASSNLITTWHTAESNYPSNSDIWWTFKDATGAFNPASTVANVTLNAGPAPQGYFVLAAFAQDRSLVSSIAGLTAVVTTARPRCGAFFQGRVWYAGVDDSNPATGDAAFYNWSENIYFSQVVTQASDFGLCYQTNDPTSETLNDELPTDGGVIVIPGAGSIYKLFVVTNGILVFAANGIWFITGNSALGFTATDYNISKISGEHALSSTSFVDVAGYPMFWNANGIYYVSPGQSYTSGQVSLQVQNLTLSTIKTFYQSIPLASKMFARGSYNHLTGVVQWVYRSTQESGLLNRYAFDSVLNFLTYTQSFYPWTVNPGQSVNIVSADYLEIPQTSGTGLQPMFYYMVTQGGVNITFASESPQTVFTDFATFLGTGVSYTSSFTTGYRLKGGVMRRTQPQYVYVFSEDTTSGYTIQGIWDYAASNLSNRFSGVQVVNNNQPLYNKMFRRHRIRGQGNVLQFKISSVNNNSFNLAGWAVLDTMNAGV